jgi:hypothetical protein
MRFFFLSLYTFYFSLYTIFMIATSHVIIGGAVGVATATITQNPIAALFAGIVSHIVCDTLPHLDAPFRFEYENGQYDQPVWNKKLLTWAIIDSLAAMLIILFLWNRNFGLEFFSPFAWGALGGYLPDLVDNFPLWGKQIRQFPGFRQFHKLHLAVHNLWRFRYPMPDHWILGSLTQIAFVIPALYYITK